MEGVEDREEPRPQPRDNHVTKETTSVRARRPRLASLASRQKIDLRYDDPKKPESGFYVCVVISGSARPLAVHKLRKTLFQENFVSLFFFFFYKLRNLKKSRLFSVQNDSSNVHNAIDVNSYPLNLIRIMISIGKIQDDVIVIRYYTQINENRS